MCLGNICRSPLAEAIFNDLLRQEELDSRVLCDSAGTSDYHIGKLPDERTLEVVNQKGLSLEHRARQFTKEDFRSFDYIVAMDESNLFDIKALATKGNDDKQQLFLMREFDDTPGDTNVPDPYWGGDRGFFEVHDILLRSCSNLLRFIKSKQDIQ